MRDAERFDGAANVFGDGDGGLDGSGGEDDGELFSAKAGGGGGVGEEGVGDLAGDDAEAVVAAEVAVDVVVGLEAVDVDEEKREGVAVAEGVLPGGFEVLVEGAAVGEAGEGVDVGELR